MQYEFRAKTIQDAVRQAVSNGRCRLDHKREAPPCVELERQIQETQRDLEQTLQEIEGVEQEIERRLQELGDQARNALIPLAVDVVLTAVSAVGFGSAAITVATAAKIGRNVVKRIVGAVGAASRLKRNIDSTLSNLEAVGEFIDINAIRNKLNRDMHNVELYAARLEFLSNEYENAGCGGII